jgi:hypothetical protein
LEQPKVSRFDLLILHGGVGESSANFTELLVDAAGG